MKKVFAAGIALAVLFGGNTALAATDTTKASITQSSTSQSDYTYSDQATQALNHLNDIERLLFFGMEEN